MNHIIKNANANGRIGMLDVSGMLWTGTITRPFDQRLYPWECEQEYPLCCVPSAF